MRLVIVILLLLVGQEAMTQVYSDSLQGKPLSYLKGEQVEVELKSGKSIEGIVWEFRSQLIVIRRKDDLHDVFFRDIEFIQFEKFEMYFREESEKLTSHKWVVTIRK